MDALEAGHDGAGRRAEPTWRGCWPGCGMAAWEPAPAVGEGQEFRSDADPETHASALVCGGLGAPRQRRRGELSGSRNSRTPE